MQISGLGRLIVFLRLRILIFFQEASAFDFFPQAAPALDIFSSGSDLYIGSLLAPVLTFGYVFWLCFIISAAPALVFFFLLRAAPAPRGRYRPIWNQLRNHSDQSGAGLSLNNKYIHICYTWMDSLDFLFLTTPMSSCCCLLLMPPVVDFCRFSSGPLISKRRRS